MWITSESVLFGWAGGEEGRMDVKEQLNNLVLPGKKVQVNNAFVLVK